jgi:hypothetical protein
MSHLVRPYIVLARPDWHDNLVIPSSSTCIAHTAARHIRRVGGGCVDTVSVMLAKPNLPPQASLSHYHRHTRLCMHCHKRRLGAGAIKGGSRGEAPSGCSEEEARNAPIWEEGATGCRRPGAKVWEKMTEFYTAR